MRSVIDYISWGKVTNSVRLVRLHIISLENQSNKRPNHSIHTVNRKIKQRIHTRLIEIAAAELAAEKLLHKVTREELCNEMKKLILDYSEPE